MIYNWYKQLVVFRKLRFVNPDRVSDFDSANRAYFYILAAAQADYIMFARHKNHVTVILIANSTVHRTIIFFARRIKVRSMRSFDPIG